MDEFRVFSTNSVVGVGSAAAVIAAGDFDGATVFIDGFVLAWSGGNQTLYDKVRQRVHSTGGASLVGLPSALWIDYGRRWAHARLLDHLDEWYRALPGRPLPPPFTLSEESDAALLAALWLRGVGRDPIVNLGQTTRSKALEKFVVGLTHLPDIRPDPS